jgi:hypothetical protein
MASISAAMRSDRAGGKRMASAEVAVLMLSASCYSPRRLGGLVPTDGWLYRTMSQAGIRVLRGLVAQWSVTLFPAVKYGVRPIDLTTAEVGCATVQLAPTAQAPLC